MAAVRKGVIVGNVVMTLLRRLGRDGRKMRALNALTLIHNEGDVLSSRRSANVGGIDAERWQRRRKLSVGRLLLVVSFHMIRRNNLFGFRQDCRWCPLLPMFVVSFDGPARRSSFSDIVL
mmetsp:Transcript_29725/g.67224  ORF Transcript_29725/g.67224 Transcript_29725/m.67224 type:complete len:120 (-) Transcript_29725:941-1300(-)